VPINGQTKAIEINAKTTRIISFLICSLLLFGWSRPTYSATNFCAFAEEKGFHYAKGLGKAATSAFGILRA